jgi:integrase
MAIFNRVYCPHCSKQQNIYDDNLKSVVCSRCNGEVLIKVNERNYFIELYDGPVRKRQKIGPSRVLAENVLKKWIVEKAEGKFLDKKKQLKIRFEDFADEYLQLHSKVNNKGWKTDEFSINTLKKYFTGKCLHEISSHMVDVFKQELAKTLRPATVNRRLCTFKTMFNKAASWGKFSGPNPVQAVKFFKLNNTRLRFLEKDEIVKLLSHCHDHLKGIVIVALNTGMRKAEILGLKWRDVDIKRNILYLHETKNGEKREVPINEQVKTVFINTLRNPQTEYVFNYNDKRIIDIKRSYCTAVKKSGIKDFTFHDLRHTFASHLVMNGVDLNTVRELLGHKSLQMTLRYSHLSAIHKHKAVEGLSKRMDTIWTPSSKFENEHNESVITSISK